MHKGYNECIVQENEGQDRPQNKYDKASNPHAE